MSSKQESSKTSGDPSSSWPSTAVWYVRNDEARVPKRNKSAFPCPRWGHASTYADNSLYVFGGVGVKASPHYWENPYRLDLETWEWMKVEANNKSIGLLDSHSMTFYQDKLIVFGGSHNSESKKDLLEFDLNTNMWKTIEAKGEVPSPREGHSACLYEGRYLVVYGGWNGSMVLGDCYLFDIPNNNWIKVEKKGGAEVTPRESHSCCLIGNYMYIFGGQGIDPVTQDDIFLNDLYRVKIQVENNKTATSVWEKLDPEGPIPTHRSSHAGCAYKDRYIFIVGGEGFEPEYYEGLKYNGSKDDIDCFPNNDVWYYDIEKNRWFNLKVKNEAEFLPRFAHTCNVFQDTLIVYGGLRQSSSNVTSEICILPLDGVNQFAHAKSVSSKPQRAHKSVSQEPEKVVKQQKEQVKEQKEQKEVPQSQQPVAAAQPKTSKPPKATTETFNPLAPTHHVGTPVVAPATEPAKELAVLPSQVELDGPFVSTSFLHSLSSLVGWPLAAFGLLVDNSLINKAANLRIDVMTRKKKNPDAMVVEEQKKNEGEITYLVVEDNGKGWKHNEFVNIFMRFDTDNPEDSNTMIEETEANPQEDERKKKINEYAFNLKSGAFRLGRTLIYVTKVENEISIGFITVNKRFNPDIHDNHVFLYSWKKDTQEYLTSQAQKNKDVIMNILSGIFTEDDLVQNLDKVSNRLYILDLNPVAMSKSGASTKAQDFELILFKKTERANDIMVRTLDESLKPFYADSPLIELSLRTYLSHFFLDPSQIGLEISINNHNVSFWNVKEIIEGKKSHPSYKHISQDGLFNGYFFESTDESGTTASAESKDNNSGGNKRRTRVQKSASEKKEYNQGALVYYENRLIRRLENPKLGNQDLLSFQVRNALLERGPLASLFEVQGYVEVKSFLKPNMFKTEIENPYYSNFLYSSMIPVISKLYSIKSLNEKRRGDESANDDLDNVTKKIKPNT